MNPFRVRDILRSNKKLGIKLDWGITLSESRRACAIGSIGAMVFGVEGFQEIDNNQKRPMLAKRLGVHIDRLKDVEIGYEEHANHYTGYYYKVKNKRYEKIGKRLREKIGHAL